MQVIIRKMGNSQGVVIPKPILRQLAFGDAAEMRIRDGALELRPLRVASDLRANWVKDSVRIAAEEPTLAWPEFVNADDETLRW